MLEKIRLEVITFFAGATVMTLEIAATRMFAPYVGTSLPVWTSIIGIILASLSIGYWLGGRRADKELSEKTLSQLLYYSAVAVAITSLASELLMSILAQYLPSVILGSIIGATILLLPASILLASVSPYVTRLRMTTMEHAGATIGRLSAVGTVGSIAGTFFAGFLLVGLVGTHNIVVNLALLLGLLSLYAKYSTKRLVLLFVLALVLAGSVLLDNALSRNMVADTDTRYNRAIIMDVQGVRYLHVGGLIESAMDLKGDELVSDYTRYYRLVDHFRPDSKKALMLGGAGYVYPRDYLAKHPGATIDVVEIDPGMTELAQKYFRLTADPALKIIHEDARTFINRKPEIYDAIFGDAFGSSYSVPYQLTTVEATRNMYKMLANEGVMITNLIGPLEGKGGRFIRAYYHTVKSVFPQVYLFPLEKDAPKEVQNVMLVAIKSEKAPAFTSTQPQLQEFLTTLWHQPITQDTPLLTDDFAPVDQYLAASIK